MKKLLIILMSMIVVIGVGGAFGYIVYTTPPPQNFQMVAYSNKQYSVKQGNTILGEYDDMEEAVLKAEAYARSVVVDNETDNWVFTTVRPYIILADNAIFDFDTFEQALSYAKRANNAPIYYKDNHTIIWEQPYQLDEEQHIYIPHITQMPELPRGCEVTALAMMLNYFGVDVSKMELAQQVAKDETPYSVDPQTGRITYGNPYKGFVGDMYNMANRGYGVYHGPIFDLANQYMPDKVIDITGAEFDDVLNFVSKGYPVWVVTNGSYAQLPDNEFELWHTPTGIVKITRRMHAVVVTGYKGNNIIINDPLYPTANRYLNMEDFKKSWEQMGNQAVIILGY